MSQCDSCSHRCVCMWEDHPNHPKGNCSNYEKIRPHGEWKIDSEYGYIFHCVCLKCNTDVMKYISGSENWWLNSVPNFCPNCGADMREGEAE